MKILATEDYNDFECIGSDCPISCCGGGWGIIIDKKSRDYYQSVEGAFREKLRSNMIEKNGEYYFKLKPNGDCAFLDEHKLCEIYGKLGEDKMCDVCKIYPRQVYQVGDIYFRYLTTSCPEVTRHIFQRRARLQVDCVDSADVGKEKEDTDWEQFNFAIRAYTTGMEVLQNRNLDIRERLALLMVFIKQFQEIVRIKGDPTALITLFSSPELYAVLLQDIPIYERNDSAKVKAFEVVCGGMQIMSYDHPMWKRYNELTDAIQHTQMISRVDLDEAFQMFDEEEMQLEMEQILAYRYFSVFMQGFEKQDYYEKLAVECVMFSAFLSFVVFSKIIQQHICSQEERILFYSLCSRLNHYEGVMDSTRKMIEGLETLDNLFRLIS